MQSKFAGDLELIKGYQTGDHRCLEHLIQNHKKRVFAYIITIVKDQALADDLFQDTFIKVIRTLRAGKYNEQGSFIYWVLRIAHNLIIDHYRVSKQMPKLENDNEDDIFERIISKEPNAAERVMQDQTLNNVRELIEMLPPEQKEVVILRHFSKMSFKEIAEECEISINTALGRMRYALINLRKLVHEKEIVPMNS